MWSHEPTLSEKNQCQANKCSDIFVQSSGNTGELVSLSLNFKTGALFSNEKFQGTAMSCHTCDYLQEY
jgi:hypothetical protein